MYRPPQNEKSTPLGAFCVLIGAYRVCGILPGEEMEQIISTTSVITSILYPERQTNVRECGARVACIKIIPLVLRILCNFSALPQYLERLRPRYANPLRHFVSSNLHVLCRRKWVRFCAERTGISLVLQGLLRRRRGCDSNPYPRFDLLLLVY